MNKYQVGTSLRSYIVDPKRAVPADSVGWVGALVGCTDPQNASASAKAQVCDIGADDIFLALDRVKRSRCVEGY